MTSVSVSYEVRRQLNTLRTMDGHKSVDSFISELIRAHKLAKMTGELDDIIEPLRKKEREERKESFSLRFVSPENQ